ncbi:hypothetical protein BB558_002970 [Smittium angustum]|uniref:Metaxin glutathione S-transferase domain-containing protein n=1 Tax=Smittium angustum TaxID=133377 RepID=A0A2U1J766_SMIAN|nr:hypothetical protein BB558_002970 [Smittium angustum]
MNMLKFLDRFPIYTFEPLYKPNEESRETLYVYGPGYKNEPASFDIQCLQLQALALFSGKNYYIKYSNKPEASPNGKLPFLINSQEVALDFDLATRDILEDNANKNTGDKEVATIESLESLVQNSLKPALNLILWADDSNYENYTLPKYTRDIQFPINLIIGRQLKAEKLNKIYSSNPSAYKNNELVDMAIECLKNLSVFIKNKEYFSGSNPGLLDAMIFSILHIIINYPGENALKNMLVDKESSCSVLLDYNKRVWDKYFS